MSRAYEYWKFQQEEPQLAVTRGNGRRHKEMPGWMVQRQEMQKMRQDMGDEAYFEMLRQDEERNNTIREYLNDEE